MKDTPRVFHVDQPALVAEPLCLKDYGTVALAPDEQITFVTESDAEYDIARKSWGYYATPSLNSRLVRFRLRAALIKDEIGKFVIVLVECGKEQDFEQYRMLEGYTIVCWMDNTEALQAMEGRLA